MISLRLINIQKKQMFLMMFEADFLKNSGLNLESMDIL
jgi:hypothetical protein